MTLASRQTDDHQPQGCKLELYVAGDSTNSRRAIANLEKILAEMGQENLRHEVIDVLKNPRVALEKRIFSTPSLILTVGSSKTLIVGDLSDREVVIGALRRS